MGILDSFKKAVSSKADELDKTYNPMRKVSDAMDEAGKAVGGNSAQAQYEAKQRALNKNNPHFQVVDDSITKKAF